MTAVRVELPSPLCRLAGLSGPMVELELAAPVTMAAVLEAIEREHPALRGTIRDPYTRERRPFLRFFALEQDLSLEPLDQPLPEPVQQGREPLLIVAGIAGG